MKTHDELIIDSLFSEGGTMARLQQAFVVDQTFKNGILIDEKKKPVFIREGFAKRTARGFKKNQPYYELIAEYHTLESNKPYANGDIISAYTTTLHGDSYLKQSTVLFTN